MSAPTIGQHIAAARTWNTSKRGAATRPYRLWSPADKKYLPYRCYVYEKNAHDGALLEVRHTKQAPSVVEVVDCRTGRLIGQYILRRNGQIEYWE